MCRALTGARITMEKRACEMEWELGRLMLNHREMNNVEISERHLQDRSRVMNRPQLAVLGDSHEGSL